MDHRKPQAIALKLTPEKQAAFIKAYAHLLNQLETDEAVILPTLYIQPPRCGRWRTRRVEPRASSAVARMLAEPGSGTGATGGFAVNVTSSFP